MEGDESESAYNKDEVEKKVLEVETLDNFRFSKEAFPPNLMTRVQSMVSRTSFARRS